MAEEDESELLILKVSKSFKKKIRLRAKKGGYGTIANYIRSVLRSELEGEPGASGRRTSLGESELSKLLERGKNETGMVLIDPKTLKIRLADDAYARMHGYSREELVGTPIKDMYPQGFRPALERHIKQIERNHHHTYITSHNHRNGSVFTVLVEVHPIMDEDAAVKFVVAHVRPINIPSA